MTNFSAPSFSTRNFSIWNFLLRNLAALNFLMQSFPARKIAVRIAMLNSRRWILRHGILCGIFKRRLLAQIQAHFVNAAWCADQSVPAPQQRWKWQSADCQHFQFLCVAKFFTRPSAAWCATIENTIYTQAHTKPARFHSRGLKNLRTSHLRLAKLSQVHSVATLLQLAPVFSFCFAAETGTGPRESRQKKNRRGEIGAPTALPMGARTKR